METEFSIRLKKAMQARGMTLDKLAMAVASNPKTISMYIRGYRYPNLDRIEEMARALRVHPVWLCGWEKWDKEAEERRNVSNI